MKQKLFALLSGEHPTLPQAEALAALEAEGVSYQRLPSTHRVLRVAADPRAAASALSRCALTRLCCLELFNCEADVDAILRHAKEVLVRELGVRGSVAVRVRRIEGSARGVEPLSLAREIADSIWDSEVFTRVDLEKPDVQLLGLFHQDKFFFGMLLRENSPSEFSKRRPSARPAFHPSTMVPKLARCMVNLSRAVAGELVLDPFCGVGGILLEAAFIGCKVIGGDVVPQMVRGALKNLRHFGVEFEGLVVADARTPYVGRVDRVVSDLPYGRAATTRGEETEELLRGLLSWSLDRIERGKCLSLATHQEVDVEGIAQDFGIELLERHEVYVHRSLTRVFSVLRRP